MEELEVRGRTLARNFEPLMSLVTEILLEPRWDATEFELARAQVTNEIIAQRADPRALADLATNLMTYGAADIRGRGVLGSRSSVAAITLADLEAFYTSNLAPELAGRCEPTTTTIRPPWPITGSVVAVSRRVSRRSCAKARATPMASARASRGRHATAGSASSVRSVPT